MIHLVGCTERYQEVDKLTGEIEDKYAERAWISSKLITRCEPGRAEGDGEYSAIGADFLSSVSEHKKSIRAVESSESPCGAGRKVA